MHQQTSFVESHEPLGRVGEYTFCPLGHCNEEQIAALISKVVARDPLLQGRRHDELMTLGRAIYRKSLPLGCSQVVLYKDKPVALNAAWDSAEGGVWEDSGLSMPESMGAHAAVTKACLNALPVDSTTPTLFAAFAGVLAPHSRKLFGILRLTGHIVARAMGFKKSFGYTVFPFLRNRAEGHKAVEDAEVRRSLDPVHFVDVATDNEAVRAELAELDGIAQVSLMPIDHTTGKAFMDVMAKAVSKAVRATPEELLIPSREFALKQVERLRRSRSGVITSNL